MLSCSERIDCTEVSVLVFFNAGLAVIRDGVGNMAMLSCWRAWQLYRNRRFEGCNIE